MDESSYLPRSRFFYLVGHAAEFELAVVIHLLYTHVTTCCVDYEPVADRAQSPAVQDDDFMIANTRHGRQYSGGQHAHIRNV